MMRTANRSSRSSSASWLTSCPRDSRLALLDDARTISPAARPAPSPSRPDDLDDLDASQAPPTPGGWIFMADGVDCPFLATAQNCRGSLRRPGRHALPVAVMRESIAAPWGGRGSQAPSPYWQIFPPLDAEHHPCGRGMAIFCRVLRQRDRLSRTDFVELLKGAGAPLVIDAVSRLNGQALVRRGAKAQEARADRTGAARLVGGTEAARPYRCGLRQPAAAAAGRFAARGSVVLRRCRRLRRLGGARSIPDAARTGATAQPLFCRGRDAARRCDRKPPSSAAQPQSWVAAVRRVAVQDRDQTLAMAQKPQARGRGFLGRRCRSVHRLQSWRRR